MIWGREEHKKLFWAGFVAGAVSGCLLGLLLASDAALETRKRIAQVGGSLRGRIDGKPKTRTHYEVRRGEPNPAQVDAENPI